MTTYTSAPCDDVAPPTFEPLNVVELVSIEDSKITGVSVYSGRAEITRLFRFTVKTGQNQLHIAGLPSVLDHDSFRVEGRGSATIHDVTISTLVAPAKPITSSTLVSLLSKEKRTEKAVARALKSLTSLETYLSSLKAESLEVGKLREVVQQYDATAGELDDKVSELESELKDAREAIAEERRKLAGPTGNEKLNLKATIGVFADVEGEIEVAIVYAVHNATWSAGYDIRVDMQAKENPVTLVYKASITQSTGEGWGDVPITLETATPTFGLGVPTLMPWTLSIYQPPVYMHMPRSRPAPIAPTRAMVGAAQSPMGGAPPLLPPPLQPMEHRSLQVSSKGSVSATFGVPGLMTVPSDGAGHNVTIAKLTLDAEMSWVCVPKKDCRVNLKAKIKNASEYTLLAGTASVYVDGSFISKSSVPHVSPDESFDCPLGLDPSVRITYHPRTKKVAQSGFYNKSANYSFTQRVTVHNAKSTSSSSGGGVKVKIIDQVPISEDSSITVKLVQPALVLPIADGAGSGSAAAAATGGGELKAPPPVKVAAGVNAMWDGADEMVLGDSGVDVGAGVDVDARKEGRFCWVCTVPAQSKVGLVLQWEVAAPVETKIAGI